MFYQFTDCFVNNATYNTYCIVISSITIIGKRHGTFSTNTDTYDIKYIIQLKNSDDIIEIYTDNVFETIDEPN